MYNREMTKVFCLALVILAFTSTADAKAPVRTASKGGESTSASAAMALIPAGEFWMGSLPGKGQEPEHPVHKVYLDAFSIDKRHVTVADYRKFAVASETNTPKQPPYSAGNHPVVNVTWAEAEAYCHWAGKRLPTEAEWEKAARGGLDGTWSFGIDETILTQYAWYSDNSGGSSHPVGQKGPNRYGLYDVAGNACQWVADWYSPGYYKESPARNPRGPASGSQKVLRGGWWDNDAASMRVAGRGRFDPKQRFYGFGFRCAK